MINTELALTVSRLGDVWRLGNHKVICGDSGDSNAISKLMGGDLAKLCFTSPPYGYKRDYKNVMVDWDALMQSVFSNVPMDNDGQVLVNLGLVHKNNECLFYWTDWCAWMKQIGWRQFGLYVWDQGQGLPGHWSGRLAPNFELIFHFNKVTRIPNKIVKCKYAGYVRTRPFKLRGKANKDMKPVEHTTGDMKIPESIVRVQKQSCAVSKTLDHPAVFPVKLPQFIYETYSNELDVVFEPFCGSGSSIIAAEITNRKLRGCEISPEYVDVSLMRFMNIYPSAIVTLEGSGLSFFEVAKDRGVHCDQIYKDRMVQLDLL